MEKAEKYATRGGDTSMLRQLEYDINSLMDKEAKSGSKDQGWHG